MLLPVCVYYEYPMDTEYVAAMDNDEVILEPVDYEANEGGGYRERQLSFDSFEPLEVRPRYSCASRALCVCRETRRVMH